MRFVNIFLTKKMLLALLIFVVVSLGTLWQVEKRIRADEWIWVPLGVRFVDAIKESDFEKTRVSTRPGITVSWVSGLVTSTTDYFDNNEIIRLRELRFVDIARESYVINRIVFGLLTAAFVTSIFLVLTKLFDWKRAFVTTALIGVHPLTLFKGNIVWTDLFLALFMFLAVSTYLIYWKSGKASFLVAAGVLFGLSIATKTVGIVLIPSFLIASLLTSFDKRTLKRALLATISATLFGLAIFYLIYPYLWGHLMGIFDRYSEFGQQIGFRSQVIDSSASLLYYPRTFFNIDPVLTVTSTLLLVPMLWQYFHGKSVPFSLIATSATAILYVAVLIFVSQFTYLSGTRISSSRYVVPAIYLMTLFLIEAVFYFSKKNFPVLWLIPAVMFAVNLYNLYFFFPCEINEC